MDVGINKIQKRKEQEEKLPKVRVRGWDYLVLPD
jgi:hypothetical protein